MATYSGFTLRQLGEGYMFHAAQDCVVSQRMAKEILTELRARKGQRAAKIRNAFGFQTYSCDGALWLFDAADAVDSTEPSIIIDRKGNVACVVTVDHHLLHALETLV